MISNPTASPLFWPLASTLGGLFAVGFILILTAERFRLATLPNSSLFQRWLVWAVIAPLYSLAALSGAAIWTALITLIVVQAIREYARLVGLPRLYQYVLLAMGVGIGPLAMWAPDQFFAVPPLLLIVATLQPLLTQDVRQGMRLLALAALGFGYLPFLLDHLVLVHRWIPGGPGLLLIVGLSVALSDVGAFAVGKAFGRHRLSPVVSPNKTWEGVLGNVIGAYLGALLLSFAMPPALPGAVKLVFPLIIAVGAAWGDLVESALKREFGVKDAGSWLPGFGGLLDRIDSLIVVGPLVYHLARLTGSG